MSGVITLIARLMVDRAGKRFEPDATTDKAYCGLVMRLRRSWSGTGLQPLHPACRFCRWQLAWRG